MMFSHMHNYLVLLCLNIVPHKALASVLISKNLAELAAEGS